MTGRYSRHLGAGKKKGHLDGENIMNYGIMTLYEQIM